MMGISWPLALSPWRAIDYRERYEQAKLDADFEMKRASEWSRVAQEEIAKRQKAEAEVARLKKEPTMFCSFCRKSQHDVRKLIAGHASFICDECIGLCVEVLKEGEPGK